MHNKHKVWDRVYQRYKPSELPWYNLPFPQEIIEELGKLDKNKCILVPGCGTGESVQTLWDMGFKNNIGTDISETAINTAKKNLPGLEFRVLPTEQISEKYSNMDVLD